MDKKELVGFILKDIKELELIVKGMYEMDMASEVIQELVISKTKNILDKFYHLKGSFPEEEKRIVRPFLEEKKEEPEEKPNIPERKKEEIFFEKTENNRQEGEILKEPQPILPEEDNKKREKDVINVEEEPEKTNRGQTTNEKFKSQVPPVHAAVAVGKRIESRFVQNLRKAINLNDRYRYQRELFGGNIETMNSVIDKLDAMESLEEAMNYVQKEFAWDPQSDTVADFYSLLESRFS